MKIENHTAQNYRNLKHIDFTPSEGINIIYGENGQGKTNIIESIWLFTGCHSFRTRKCVELIKETEKSASLEMDFYARGRSQNAQMKIEAKREVKLNGIPQETPRVLLGEFQAVVFSPSLLSIIQDGPAEKRRFMDIAISLLKPNYAAILSKYIKTMAQRNTLLKQIAERGLDEDLLCPWDEELSKLGAKVTGYRLHYIEHLSEIAGGIYEGISSGREQLSVKYIKNGKIEGGNENELFESMLSILEKNRRTDIRRQFTTAGPHKDDLAVDINGLCARNYGSQGQQRSCALALKLSEASIIKETTGEQPVALLDDVMSELDLSRQTYLLNYLEGWQVFITCCDPSVLQRVNNGKTFEVEAGRIKTVAGG